MKNLLRIGMMAMLLPLSGFAASIFFEGTQGRLVDGNGRDVADTPGALALCDVFTVGAGNTCTGNDTSDIFVWTAVNNPAGVQIATNFAFCSDTADGADGGDPFITGCSNLTQADFNAMNHLDILEATAVGGVEINPYTPLTGQPGFNAIANPSYSLISDVPEPASFAIVGTGLIGLLWAARKLRRQ